MSDDATIWGHTEVHIEKVPARRVWIVSTAHLDPKQRQPLCEVPWADAFRTFPHNPNYTVAVATCQSDESTALTEEEEELVHAQPLGDSSEDVTPVEGPTKVLSLADFRARRKT